MKNITVLWVIALAAAFISGCSFFSREISLVPALEFSAPSEKPIKSELNLQIEDAREEKGLNIGTGGLWFTSVTTADDPVEWVRKSVKCRLEAAGMPENSRSNTVLRLKIEEIHTRQWPLVLSSCVRINAAVSSGGKWVPCKTRDGSARPFCLLITDRFYEATLKDALSDWIKKNIPAIQNAVLTAKNPQEKKTLENQRYYLASVLRRQKTLDFLASI